MAMFKFKKMLCLAGIALLGMANVVQAAENIENKKRVELIYKVPDAVLQCQNKEENIEEGKKEFEKFLLDQYGKRFNIRKIEYMSLEEKYQLPEYLNKVGPMESPLLVIIELKGSGTTTDTYQNAFGAKTTVLVPTTKLSVMEALVNRKDGKYGSYSSGTLEYSAGSLALGRDVYVGGTDPRKRTKNAIKDAIKDICTENTSINKYADPDAYQNEKDRYSGNFYKIAERNAVKAREHAAVTKDQKERIEKFKAYCLKDKNSILYGLWTGSLYIWENDPETILPIIDSMKEQGLYKE